MWLNADRSFTLAREVAVDLELGILLTIPAREYAELRGTPLFNVTAASPADAARAVAAAPAAAVAAVDVELTFSWAGGATPKNGSIVGLTVQGGLGRAEIRFSEPHGALLIGGAGSGMRLTIKPGETAVSLRVIVDGSIVEGFAQGGRAQLHATLGPGERGGLGLLANAPGLTVSAAAWELAQRVTPYRDV